MFHLGKSKLMRLILDQQWDDALFHLAEHPNEARRWDTIPVPGKQSTVTANCLPIHAACALSPPTFALIEELVRFYPEALKEIDSYFKRTPLHTACCKGASTDILHFLMDQYPSAASKQDSMGRVPLHYAMFDHVPLETATKLLQLYPEAAKVQDYKGWLPLHVACRNGATRDILVMLIDVFPEGLNVTTKSCGMTPLMCADRHHVFTEKSILDLLRGKHDESTGNTNDNKNKSESVS